MDIKRILKINAEIEKIKHNKNLTEFEKYYQLLILERELEDIEADNIGERKTDFNFLFGLN